MSFTMMVFGMQLFYHNEQVTLVKTEKPRLEEHTLVSRSDTDDTTYGRLQDTLPLRVLLLQIHLAHSTFGGTPSRA